jgi:hypothetical protein
MISGFLSPRHGASSGCGWMNGLRIWRVAANMQSRTADKGWSSSLGVGRGSNNSSHYKITMLRNISQTIDCTLQNSPLNIVRIVHSLYN